MITQIFLNLPASPPLRRHRSVSVSSMEASTILCECAFSGVSLVIVSMGTNNKEIKTTTTKQTINLMELYKIYIVSETLRSIFYFNLYWSGQPDKFATKCDLLACIGIVKSSCIICAMTKFYTYSCKN